MDLREELLEAIHDLEEDGWKVISTEAVKEIIRSYDAERLRFSQAIAATMFGGEQP